MLCKKKRTNISIYLILYSYMIWLIYRSFLCPKGKKSLNLLNIQSTLKHNENDRRCLSHAVLLSTYTDSANKVLLKTVSVKDSFLRHGMKFQRGEKTTAKQDICEGKVLSVDLLSTKKPHTFASLYTNSYFYKRKYADIFIIAFLSRTKHDMPCYNK